MNFLEAIKNENKYFKRKNWDTYYSCLHQSFNDWQGGGIILLPEFDDSFDCDLSSNNSRLLCIEDILAEDWEKMIDLKGVL